MKKSLFIIICALSALMLLVASCTAPPKDANRAQISEKANKAKENADLITVPIDFEKSSFEFEGYGPGKSHIGKFDKWEGVLFVKENQIIGGRGKIDASSVNTGISGLDKHLKSDDFFDIEKYPEILFVSSSLSSDKKILTGDLTFHGVTKEVNFPVEITPESISTDFILDTTPFGMKYAGVNKEVRIAFTFSK